MPNSGPLSSYSVPLDEPPQYDNLADLNLEARQLFTIYHDQRIRNSSTDHRGCALPFFIVQYDEPEEDDNGTTTVDFRDHRLSSVTTFNKSLQSFFKQTEAYWNRLRNSERYNHVLQEGKGFQDRIRERKKKEPERQVAEDESETQAVQNESEAEEEINTNDRDTTPAVEQLAKNAAIQGNDMAGLITLFGQFLTNQSEVHRQQLEAIIGIQQKATKQPDNRFRIDYIGVFQPDLATDATAALDISTQGSTVIFQDVDLFLDAANQAGYTHGTGLIAQHLHLCLRGAASIWYGTVDLPTKRHLAEDLHKWVKLLRKRFRMSLAQAGARYDTQKYTVTDVTENNDPYAYVMAIERYGRIQNLPTSTSMSRAWRGLDIVLRKQIDEPDEDTTAHEFAENLRKKMPLWREEYAQYGRSRYNRYDSQNTVSDARRRQAADYSAWRKEPGLSALSGAKATPQTTLKASPAPAHNFNKQPYQPTSVNLPRQQRYAAPQQLRNQPSYIQPHQKLQTPPVPPKPQGLNYPNAQTFHSEAEEPYPLEDSSEDDPQAHYSSAEVHNDDNDSMDDRHHYVYSHSAAAVPTKDLEPDPHALRQLQPHKPDKHQQAEANKNPPSPLATDCQLRISTDAKELISPIKPDPQQGLGYRRWFVARIKAALTRQGQLHWITPDSGCNITLIDRKFLFQERPGITLLNTLAPIGVRPVGNKIVYTSQYVMIDIFIPGIRITKNGGSPNSFTRITIEAYVVKKLDANLLLANDTLGPLQAVLDFKRNTFTIGTTNLVTLMKVQSRTKATPVDRPLKAIEAITIPAYSAMQVPVKVNQRGLPDRDYIVEPVSSGVMPHLTDKDVNFVVLANTTALEHRIPRNATIARLCDDVVGEVAAWNGVAADHHIARMTAAATKDEASIPDRQLMPLERRLDSQVTVYGTDAQSLEYQNIIDAFPDLWKDRGTVNLPPDQWMSVPLVSDWNVAGAKLAHKVYPLSAEDKKLVDEKFNAMHEQGRMSWVNKPTPFGFPVFVVWRTVPAGSGDERRMIRKGRVVVDIRGLNKVTTTDAYPLPLQQDIISALADCVTV